MSSEEPRTQAGEDSDQLMPLDVIVYVAAGKHPVIASAIVGTIIASPVIGLYVLGVLPNWEILPPWVWTVAVWGSGAFNAYLEFTSPL